jgi:hypothetical protein
LGLRTRCLLPGFTHPLFSFGFTHPSLLLLFYLGLRTRYFLRTHYLTWVYAHPLLFYWVTHPLFLFGFTHLLSFTRVYAPVIFIWVHAPFIIIIILFGFTQPMTFIWVLHLPLPSILGLHTHYGLRTRYFLFRKYTPYLFHLGYVPFIRCLAYYPLFYSGLPSTFICFTPVIFNWVSHPLSFIGFTHPLSPIWPTHPLSRVLYGFVRPLSSVLGFLCTVYSLSWFTTHYSIQDYHPSFLGLRTLHLLLVLSTHYLPSGLCTHYSYLGLGTRYLLFWVCIPSIRSLGLLPIILFRITIHHLFRFTPPLFFY